MKLNMQEMYQEEEFFFLFLNRLLETRNINQRQELDRQT